MGSHSSEKRRGGHGRRRALLAATGVGVVAALCAGSFAGAAPTAVPTVTGDARVDALLAKMTLDEKLTMIEGQAQTAADRQYQAGYLPGIARLGIPDLTLSDGPPGVVTKQDSTGMVSTMGLAATFSRSDAQSDGVVIGRDADALGQDVVLEPFVNMDRDTSASRDWNTFGEDALLTSQMGASQITGIQSTGTMAQVKHYIAYDGGNNVSVDQQTLHEIYLAPFDAAVKAGVSSVMCSYNAINSSQVSSCGDTETLTNILRNELGFKGFVTSDWGGNHATTYMNAGLDMEMPGGVNGLFSKTKMTTAINNGSIQVSRITEAVGRILYMYDQFGLLDKGTKHNPTAQNRNKDNQAIQQTAEDAAVLLQNKGNILPLNTSKSIAMIGPGAGQTIATYGSGEKSGGIASQQIGTYQVLKQQLGANGKNLSYAKADDMTGTPVPASAFTKLTRTNPDGTTTTGGSINSTVGGGNALPAGTAHTWTGTFTAPEAGTYWMNLQILGGTGSVTVDGTSVASASARYGRLHATDGNAPVPTTDGLANYRAAVQLTAGTHTVSLTQAADASNEPVQVRLAWVTPTQQANDRAAAITAAKNASTAVVFAWAAQESDLSVPLPNGQDQLISDIAAVNKNVVVVLNNSQPIAMPWLSQVKGVLDMWYPGDRGGYAGANVLTGAANPAGKLPFTWPASVGQGLAHQADHPERSSAGVGNQCPGFSGFNSPWACAVTTYSEGVNLGYRFYDATGQTPLYRFGYGLSYNSVKYSQLSTAFNADGGLTVSVQVTNNGTAGDAVPQVYLSAPASPPAGAQFSPKTLVGFDRVHLDAGQSKTVSITVPVRQLQYWSTSAGWTTATGARTVTVAADAGPALLSRPITVS